MSDKQISSFMLLVVLAFLFYLYNQKTSGGNKLSEIIGYITGKTVATPAATSSGTGGGVYGEGASYQTWSGDYNAAPSVNGLMFTPTYNSLKVANANGVITPLPVGNFFSMGDV